MSYLTLPAIRGAICGCITCNDSPNCPKNDPTRMHLVDINSATQRVADLVINGYRAWKEAGPMSRVSRLEREMEDGG